MTTRTSPSLGRRVRVAMLSPVVRTHLLVVGVVLLAAGVLTLRLLPALAAMWIVVTVVVVAHIGLLSVIGGAVLRWAARRGRDD